MAVRRLSEAAIRAKAREAGYASARKGGRVLMWNAQDAAAAQAEYDRLKAAQRGLTDKG